MENGAVLRSWTLYRIGDEEDTLLAVNRIHHMIPADVVEVTGYNKSIIYKDWEINNEDTKQKGTA